MRNKRALKTIFFLTAGLAVVTAGGCSSDNAGNTATATTGTAATGGTAGKKLRIAVIPKGATHEYWKSIHAGAQRAADEFGIEIVWKGPMKEDDRDDQIKVVEDMTNTKVDGIVLAPLDDTALRTPVTEAQKAGIPVLIIDSGLKDVETVSFVATDNEKAGESAGKELVAQLGGKGRVMMLRYEEGSASTTQREEGFEKAVKAAPGITVVSDNQYGGATTESAQKASENLLARFAPGGNLQVDGIFCCNESTAFGMLRALQDAKLAGKVKFVGFDSSDLLVKGLEAGQINALVVQNPEKMGYLGVKTMVDSINKKPVEKRIDTGATVVNAKNLNTPDVQKLLAPPKM